MRRVGPRGLAALAALVGLVLVTVAAGYVLLDRRVTNADMPPRSGDGSPLSDPVPGELAFRPVPLPRGVSPVKEYAPAAPAAGAPVLGVASFNMNMGLSKAQLRADARRLTRRSDVDIVGWQESNHSENMLTALPGWRTKFFDARGHIYFRDAVEDAVSWRADAFTYVSSSRYLMHDGHDEGTTFPFPNRWVTRVTLRHRATGHLVTILNTHLNHRTESYRAGERGTWNDSLNARYAKTHLRTLAAMWRAVPGRYVVGTGDYNLSAAQEMVRKPEDGITRLFAGQAVSSWAALGTAGEPLTSPDRDGDLDYVFAQARALDEHWLTFRSHDVLTGYHSDHRPLLARFDLR